MLPFSTLLRISRPRFWHYVLGPMLIFFASMGFFHDMQVSFLNGSTERIFNLIIIITVLGYFTLPANLWIYGWNDIADGDTDKFNTKKGTYEEKIENSDIVKKKLKWNIWGWNIGYIVIGSFIISGIGNLCIQSLDVIYMCEHLFTIEWIKISVLQGLYFITLSFIILISFLISAYLYSCKPLRAKAKPFIDGIMNVLYIIIPFVITVFLGQTYNLQLITYNFFASLFRCMAMHCYSAIPDIEPDRQAGLNTTAVYLGKQNSLIYCAVLYTLAAVLSFPVLGWFSVIAGVIYISMMMVSYKKKDIFSLYKLFPYINLVVGFCLFWYIILYL